MSDLPPPLPDHPVAEVDEQDLEEAVRRQVGESAEGTFALLLRMMKEGKPTRALNLIEVYTKTLRSFLVEVSEPEHDLDREDERLPPFAERMAGQRNLGGVPLGGVGVGPAGHFPWTGIHVRDPYETGMAEAGVQDWLDRDPVQRRLRRGARHRIRQATADEADRRAVAQGTILDLVRTNCNGLMYALGAARGLDDEIFMEIVRSELGRVMVMEGASAPAGTRETTVGGSVPAPDLGELIAGLDLGEAGDEELEEASDDEPLPLLEPVLGPIDLDQAEDVEVGDEEDLDDLEDEEIAIDGEEGRSENEGEDDGASRVPNGNGRGLTPALVLRGFPAPPHVLGRRMVDAMVGTPPPEEQMQAFVCFDGDTGPGDDDEEEFR